MNRAEVTKWFIDKLNQLQPGNRNVETYTTYLNALTDLEFSELMVKLKNGDTILPYYAANLYDRDVGITEALKVGDSLGINFFQQLLITDDISGTTYLTPERYFIVHLPIRRQAQHVDKGKSVALNNKYTDTLTGQATGPSRTSRLSLPEIIYLESANLTSAITEFINIRGGNVLGFREAKRQTLNTGQYSLHDIGELGSRPTSSATLHALLLGMAYENNA